MNPKLDQFARQQMVMLDDQEAARPYTVSGWLSRDGYFYDDEGVARYAGCTHRPCEECGAPTPKMYVYCEPCCAKRARARYEAMPEAQWDGKQMVYSEARERFYTSPEDAEDELDEGEDIRSLQLVLCVPQYTPVLDTDYFACELPEDDEAPDQLLEAIDAFNAATKGLILSWHPGQTRLLLEEAPDDPTDLTAKEAEDA